MGSDLVLPSPASTPKVTRARYQAFLPPKLGRSGWPAERLDEDGKRRAGSKCHLLVRCVYVLRRCPT